MAAQVGIDTGGTFTDVVRRLPDGTLDVAKVPSTPADPSEAFAAALRSVASDSAICDVRHGTTVGTNAVLTRRGAPVALVTNAGFEGMLSVGRGERASLHSLRATRESPLVAPRRVLGIAVRRDVRGRRLCPLDPEALELLSARVRRTGAKAVAVALLHAARYGADERRVARVLRRTGLPVSCSSALSADHREVERALTAVLDAFVAPVIGAYVQRVQDAMPSFVRSLHVCRSDGGRMNVDAVRASPVRTLLSGPAAGTAAAAGWARTLELERAVSFDMGGTSTDVAWIEAGEPRVRPELRVGPWRAGVSSIAIETVGAGGGSVVSLDAGGALRVGPESAGADPGPAAYGRGGPFTLTDAWVARGNVPDTLAGGTVSLDRGASVAQAARLAERAGMSRARFLDGAIRVAATTTAGAIRAASATQGHDPRGASLIAFGGAGPMLACESAAVLGMREVIVPPHPGALAAAGTLVAPLRADAEAACAPEASWDALARTRDALRADVRKTLARQGGRAPRFETEIEACYVGQAFALTVPFDRRWRQRFVAAHRARYGFAQDGAVESVRLRVRGRARDRGPAPGDVAASRRVRKRTLRVGAIERSALRRGDRLVGPLRIDEPTATTWVPSGWRATLDPSTCLRLEPVS